ncbi:MAG: DUF1320 family protein [Magnetococcales bacterium]|nr:DUF1320 family protein [Magnetococcales bacterium]
MYATPADLLRQFGPAEIAGIARPDDLPASVRVTGELMRLTVSGEDRAAFSAEERAAADRCLLRIQAALEQASRMMDSYLSRRHSLPLAVERIAVNPLQQICGDLARFTLDDDSKSEVTTSRWHNAIRWLEGVAAGRALLAVGESSSTSDAGRVIASPGVAFFRGAEGF